MDILPLTSPELHQKLSIFSDHDLKGTGLQFLLSVNCRRQRYSHKEFIFFF